MTLAYSKCLRCKLLKRVAVLSRRQERNNSQILFGKFKNSIALFSTILLIFSLASYCVMRCLSRRKIFTEMNLFRLIETWESCLALVPSDSRNDWRVFFLKRVFCGGMIIFVERYVFISRFQPQMALYNRQTPEIQTGFNHKILNY